MKDYYYIKISVYGSATLYLNKKMELDDTPDNLYVFKSVDDAVDAKRSIRFDQNYSYDQVEIKRF